MSRIHSHPSLGVLGTLPLFLSATACTAIVDTSTDGCRTHAECQKKFDNSAFCRHDGVCATLFTERCAKLYHGGEPNGATREGGKLPSPDAVILGFMGPLGDTYAEGVREAATIGVRQIGSVYPQGVGHPLALLECDDSLAMDDDVKEREQVFVHLAEHVKAPAVIGPVFSSTTLHVLNVLDRHGDTMLLSPSATAINFTSEVSPRLWRTVPPDTYQVDALVELYKKVSADSKIQNPRLVVVACQAEGWCDSFRSTLIGALRDVAYERPLAFPNGAHKKGAPEWAELAAQIKQLKPDFIIGAGIDEIGSKLIPELEKEPNAIAPVYLFPEAERGEPLKETIKELATRNIQARILGTAPGPRVPAVECSGDLDPFLSDVTNKNLGEFAYDAAFLLAYALSRSTDPHPGGVALAQQLATLSCSDPGKLLLRAGTGRYAGDAKRLGMEPDVCADYCGVSGPLNFPVGPLRLGTNREAASDIGFWCPVVSANGDVEYKVPPGTLVADAEKPYWSTTSGTPALVGRDQLRFCGTLSDSDAGSGSLKDAGADASVDAGGDASALRDAAVKNDATITVGP